jgi:hypothetical protein
MIHIKKLKMFFSHMIDSLNTDSKGAIVPFAPLKYAPDAVRAHVIMTLNYGLVSYNRL